MANDIPSDDDDDDDADEDETGSIELPGEGDERDRLNGSGPEGNQ